MNEQNAATPADELAQADDDNRTAHECITDVYARVAELKAQLVAAKAHAERWRLAAEEESWPFEWQVATEYKERAEKAEAQLAEARRERDNQTKRADSYARTAQAVLRDAGPALVNERKRVADLRAALEKVEAWMASEDEPLFKLWEDGDICEYDDNPLDKWEDVLTELRNRSIDPAILGYGTEWPEVALYREILLALSPQSADNRTAHERITSVCTERDNLKMQLAEANAKLADPEYKYAGSRIHRDSIIARRDELDELRDEIKTLRAALEPVEWVGEGEYFGDCPWCENSRRDGHKPDCARQLALNPRGEGEE